MVFHMPQKQVNIPNIEIKNIKKKKTDEFNFLMVTSLPFLMLQNYPNFWFYPYAVFLKRNCILLKGGLHGSGLS